MKAPDKIYLQHYYKPEALSEDWSLVSHPIEKNEEYILKDALLELIREESKFWDVNEMIDQKGVAIVDTIDNYSGHQTINTIRFVGEDEDKPRPLPCKYYHVWLKAAKEGFLAGAEWQKSQMELDGIVTLTESDFDAEKEKASGWGYNLCKEQMMNGAVDGEITVGRLPDDWSLAYNPDELHRALLKFKSGDKVKIIIVKQ